MKHIFFIDSHSRIVLQNKKGYTKIKKREKRQIVDFFNFREIMLSFRLKFLKISRGQNFANRGVPKISRGQNFAKMAKIRENREN